MSTPPQTLSDIERQLGRRIMELRLARGLTLETLAAQTDFTKGYLSKIENSKVIPPIGTLLKLANVLKTDLSDLLGAPTLAERNNEICLVRSWERKSVMRGGSSFGYDYMSLASEKAGKRMDPFLLTLPCEVAEDVSFEHNGEEFLFVLSGEIEFRLQLQEQKKSWVLATGDSVYFNSNIPHRLRSLKGESQVVMVIYHDAEDAARPKEA